MALNEDPPRLPALAVAGVAAAISGVSVFVNDYGVRAVRQPAVYTTAKNLFATAILAGLTAVSVTWARRRRSPAGTRAFLGWLGDGAVGGRGAMAAVRAGGPARLAALAYVGVVGGGVAFVLFFDGLARSAATPAAFLRGTLILWVAVLAVPFLGERVRAPNVAAIALLVGGEIVITKGTGAIAASPGQVMILAATVLWAVEIIVAKRLLGVLPPATLSLVRMGVGSVVLLGYLAVTGALGALVSLDAGQLGWVAVTGLLLAGYVATWFTALSRAPAVDVTSMLIGAVLVTAALQAMSGTSLPAAEGIGLCLVAAGTAVVALAWPRPRARVQA